MVEVCLDAAFELFVTYMSAERLYCSSEPFSAGGSSEFSSRTTSKEGSGSIETIETMMQDLSLFLARMLPPGTQDGF